MRTTVRLDDDLAQTVKELAHKEDTSFGRMLNRVLRAGIAAAKTPIQSRLRFKQGTFDMGEPAFNVDKALALAALLEDEETARKLALRK
jgi:predicted DNA-binding ribbon-helix-helix protein